jgi:16S rRNA A1518/A1519 N6-dimethyltransferase RsmA/KsgA/DIM1 with predicted DNA glycosylase/AP lyase activity
VERFRRLAVGLFGFRRKQLGRGLRELTGWEAKRVEAVLTAAGIDPSARPETVPPPALAALLRALVDGGWAPR